MGRRRFTIHWATRSLDWVLERVEVGETHDWGYRVKCPAHADNGPSLSIMFRDDGEGGQGYSLKCFSGCSVRSIYEALETEADKLDNHVEEFFDPVPEVLPTPSPSPSSSDTPVVVIQGGNLDSLQGLAWWSEYTGVPRDFWEKLGVQENDEAILFTTPTGTKFRVKEKRWASGKPDGDFWPVMPDEELKEVWLAEGESDAGILQYLGLPAYTLGGVSNFRADRVIDKLERWGVERVIICFDCDGPGKAGGLKLLEGLSTGNLEVVRLDIRSLLRNRRAEKDIRDVFLRIGRAAGDRLRELAQAAFSDVRARTSAEYAALARDDIPWIMQDVASLGSVTLFTGEAKRGKTTFMFSLVRKMAEAFVPGDSTASLIGCRVAAGNVVYMTEDNPQAWKVKVDNHLVGVDSTHIRVMPHSDWHGESWEEKLRGAERVIRHFGASLLVVDPIPIWADIDDENDATLVNRKMEPLRLIAQRTGAAIIAIHYTNKSGNYRGSGAFIAVPDIICELTVETRGGEELRRIDLKSKLAITPEPIYYEYDHTVRDLVVRGDIVPVLVNSSSSGSDTATTSVRDGLLSLGEGEWGVREIAESCGYVYRSSNDYIAKKVKKELEKLLLRGLVEKKEGGPGGGALWRSLESGASGG